MATAGRHDARRHGRISKSPAMIMATASLAGPPNPKPVRARGVCTTGGGTNVGGLTTGGTVVGVTGAGVSFTVALALAVAVWPRLSVPVAVTVSVWASGAEPVKVPTKEQV